jgi:CelD/BcsL family acetyltransferase involved in cellulose biosynthesis
MSGVAIPTRHLEKVDISVPAAAALDVAFLPFSEGITKLENISSRASHGFSCSPHWVGHWAGHVNSNVVFVTAMQAGQLKLILPVEIVKKAGLVVAQFVGGSHANANFPVMLAPVSPSEARSFLSALENGLRQKPWCVDVIMLQRQLERLEGIENPLLANGSSISPNVSLHLDVIQSFDTVLEARSGKRKRKRYRSQQRKFEAAGGFEVFDPAPKIACGSLLDTYFTMKANQLSGKGVTNVFGNAREQAFFKALFADEGPHYDHKFYLSSLDVGGKTRAIYGSSLHGSRQMVHFTAFANDELTTASPGDFLNFLLIEAACKNGVETYDLGIGDEGYKRSWCDVETWHRDTVIGVSLRGKLAKIQFGAIGSTKRWIKTNEKLWNFAKRVRKFKHGKTTDRQTANHAEDGSEL